MAREKLVTAEEVQKHSSASDCWLVIDGHVWDFTEFAPEHPGGAGIIHHYAGKDATTAYNSIHTPLLLPVTLASSKHIGKLEDPSNTLPTALLNPPQTCPPHLSPTTKPPLHTLISSNDFEAIASRTLAAKTWAFYSSAATDLISYKANIHAFDRIWWRPRILRNVRDVNTKTQILGCEAAVPFFVAPAAIAKLVHEEGEKAIARACGRRGVVQCISTNASFPVAEIVPTAPPFYPFFFQLYVNKDRESSARLLRSFAMLPTRPIRAIFVTVDAPVPGKREADERVRADESLSTPMSGVQAKNDAKGGGLGRTMAGYIDATLSWEDLEWLKEVTDLPIVLKGVMCAADAMMAVEYGVQGIVLSNHGGRNLDTSPPAIHTLLELHLNCPHIFDSLEVLLDGGIRRGTDILKALCLGATAVGIGRPFLYALNYGQEGVEHYIDIMKDELEVAMRLVGITDLAQCHPGLMITFEIDHLIPRGEEHPYAKKRVRSKM
ncbi:hypothetical protein K432DRAFT_433938 [Lepidopterella palustris CBS 459.81]|uniref:L-lactate dehydrogenase (cytochrome) n=1 Tax=Lepidopterella palustris CBS 459.81 TaxID=1314670 RepID=A0A8E2JGF9_9PEZI|nr:hypothetical protein K432DRAFT_433938 [Lepidopterella palustris CBS 459.81]